ncbi:class F sortase [Modestobacter sp. VKM Ac-2977]|uniref:class F sortase n=1 Tax=Modestobacter sp. VKM Ac-2977 TaxID=3004131 RepID=UPI0022AAD85E|nr:class F sortase [Modestobacter sp. VKM Ac-2977]MCZ2819621.1 class F sortase [Modestobacter sp. VKM Ac-2977]
MRSSLQLTRRTAALAGVAVLGVVAVLLALVLTGGRGDGAVRAAAAPSVTTSAPAPSTTPAVPTPEAPPPTPTPTPTAETPRTSSVRLEVPSVDLDVPVFPYTPRGGVIDPPSMVDGYWVQPYGEPGAQPDNTVYIAGHSWTKGAAAFNALMPGDHGAGVSTGDVVTVRTSGGSVDYTVSRTERYDKDALPGATDVWTVMPGRLVLITCFVDDDGRTTDDNFVVFAES